MKHKALIVVLFTFNASPSLGMHNDGHTHTKLSLYHLITKIRELNDPNTQYDKDPFVAIRELKASIRKSQKSRKIQKQEQKKERAEQRKKIRQQTKQDLQPFFEGRRREKIRLEQLYEYCLITYRRCKNTKQRYNMEYQQYEMACQQHDMACEQHDEAKKQYLLSNITCEHYLKAQQQRDRTNQQSEMAQLQCERTEQHYTRTVQEHNATCQFLKKEQQKFQEEYCGVSTSS